MKSLILRRDSYYINLSYNDLCNYFQVNGHKKGVRNVFCFILKSGLGDAFAADKATAPHRYSHINAQLEQIQAISAGAIANPIFAAFQTAKFDFRR